MTKPHFVAGMASLLSVNQKPTDHDNLKNLPDFALDYLKI